MAKIITLQDIRIIALVMRKIRGDWALQVSFTYLDDQGEESQGAQEAVFWEEIPVISGPEGGILPTPDNWYELTAAEAAYLTTLLTNVKTRVVARVL